MERVHQAGRHGLVQQLPHRARVMREAQVRHQRLREREAAGGRGSCLPGAARGLGSLEEQWVAARRGSFHRCHHPPLQLGRHRPVRVRTSFGGFCSADSAGDLQALRDESRDARW